MLVNLSIEIILEMDEMKDIRDELNDPRFGGRSHGSRATYAKNCHGPLCEKAERDRARQRNEDRAHRAGRPYQPSAYREYDRDDLKDAIILWHKRQIALRRLEKKAS